MPTITHADELVATLGAEIERLTGKKFGDFDQRLTALAGTVQTVMQRSSRPPGSGGVEMPPETPGRRFIASEQFKFFRETGQKRSGTFVLKAALISPPYPLLPVRLAPVANTYPALTLRDLLRPVPLDAGGSVEFARQKPTTGSAAIQWPQGSLKAELTMDFELAVAPVVTVAGWTQVARQILADDAQVADIVDTEVMHSVNAAEEAEILSGDGSPGHMTGLLTQAPVFPTVTGTSPIDTVGQAIGSLQAQGFQVSATVVNPADWIQMMQAKAVGSGAYLLGSPQGQTAASLWAVQVVLSASIAAGTFLTGAFGTAAQLYDREVRLEISLEDRDNFVRNLATVLAERRSALACRRPSGFLQGALTSTAAARQETAPEKKAK